MDASKALRPLSVVAAATVLVTGVACGPRDRRDARSQTSTSAPATTVVAAPAASTPAAAAPASPTAPASGVRTDDLEADLQQADSQLSQTGSAVNEADQNTQQLND